MVHGMMASTRHMVVDADADANAPVQPVYHVATSLRRSEMMSLDDETRHAAQRPGAQDGDDAAQDPVQHIHRHHLDKGAYFLL